jgi:hypothetical protein
MIISAAGRREIPNGMARDERPRAKTGGGLTLRLDMDDIPKEK